MPENLPPVAIDFEGFYDKTFSIDAVGSYNYLHSEKTNIYLVAIYDGTNLFVGPPEDFDWHSIADQMWLSHNRSFDKLCYLALVERGIIDGPAEHDDWECTADMCTWLRVKRALKDAVRILLKRVAPKDVRTKMKGLTPEQMRQLVLAENGKLYPLDQFPPGTPTLWDEVVKYGGDDAVDCWDLWDQHNHDFPERERLISRLTTQQAHHGIKMDVKRMRKDVEMLLKAKATYKSLMPWAKDQEDDEGILSIPKLKRAIKEAGYEEPPGSVAEDDDKCKEWEERNPGCLLISYRRDYNKINILLRRYEHVLNRVRPDGRFQFAWMYGGTGTLRWSGGSGKKKGGTGETGFNVQNIPKEPLWIIQDHGQFILIEKDDPRKAKAHGCDLRACCIAGKGKKWVVADAEQIEARVAKWFAAIMFDRIQDWDDLQKIANGMSVYEVFARRGMHWTGGDLKAEDPQKYFDAKQCVLGLQFQCGWMKFMARMKQLGHPISSMQSKKLVYGFRDKEQGIVKLWDYLHGEFQAAAIRNNLLARKLGISRWEIKHHLEKFENYEFELPSGRVMVFYAPHYFQRDPNAPVEKPKKTRSGVKKFINKEGDNICAWAERGGRIKFYFGGMILENLVQGFARDILCEMVLVLHAEGINMMFTSHDEVNFEADVDKLKKDIERTLNNIKPPYADGLPIAVKVDEAKYYCK